MTKTEMWTLKVSETLDAQVRAEAERRGMNLSEFIRHAVYLFFEQRDEYNRYAVECEQEAS